MANGARTIGLAGLATIALFAATVSLPGCGSKPTAAEVLERYNQRLREAVSSSVPDEQRRAQMLSIVDRAQALHVRFSQETSNFVDNYRKLNAGYDSPRAAFDQLFADYNAKRVKARAEALDLHFELASLARATEWGAISDAEIELYEEVNAARPVEEHAK